MLVFALQVLLCIFLPQQRELAFIVARVTVLIHALYMKMCFKSPRENMYLGTLHISTFSLISSLAVHFDRHLFILICLFSQPLLWSSGRGNQKVSWINRYDRACIDSGKCSLPPGPYEGALTINTETIFCWHDLGSWPSGAVLIASVRRFLVIMICLLIYRQVLDEIMLDSSTLFVPLMMGLMSADPVWVVEGHGNFQQIKKKWIS